MADQISKHDPNRTTTMIGVDSVSFTDTTTVAVNATTHELLTNSTVNGMLIRVNYDYVGIAYPDGTTEVYTFKTGGSSGTTVATITLVYTDVTKANLSTVTKS